MIYKILRRKTVVKAADQSGVIMYEHLKEFEPESGVDRKMQLTGKKHFKPAGKKMDEEKMWKKDQERLQRDKEQKFGGSASSRLAMGDAETEVERTTSRRESLNESSPVQIKDVFRWTFNWLNDNLKERNRRKIQRTYMREKTEGGELYVKGRRVFAAGMIKSRAEREREKREALQQLEYTRVEVERKMQKYLVGKRAEEEARRHRVDEERRDDTRYDDTDFKDAARLID